jgi:soluble lytic murein transglycosylase-like protein
MRQGTCPPISAQSLESDIRATAQNNGLSPDLLNAVIRQESAFVPCAISPKGALGLMQLMPQTAMILGVKDPFDPRQNIHGGARYLGQLLERYGGNLRLALSAYNAGPSQTDKYGAVPPIPETQNYVNQILRLLEPNLPVSRDDGELP